MTIQVVVYIIAGRTIVNLIDTSNLSTIEIEEQSHGIM